MPHRLLILKRFGLASARSPGVRHISFCAQPPDLPSWLYVCLQGFGLFCSLTRHLALYQVSVRRLVRFAAPLPSPQPRGFRLAVRCTWRQIPVTGLSPVRCVPCLTHQKARSRLSGLWRAAIHPRLNGEQGSWSILSESSFAHSVGVFWPEDKNSPKIPETGQFPGSKLHFDMACGSLLFQ